MDTFIHFKKESCFMKYLHTMIRVGDIDAALDFFVGKLGMVETRRKDVPEGKFTLIFLLLTRI